MKSIIHLMLHTPTSVSEYLSSAWRLRSTNDLYQVAATRPKDQVLILFKTDEYKNPTHAFHLTLEEVEDKFEYVSDCIYCFEKRKHPWE